MRYLAMALTCAAIVVLAIWDAITRLSHRRERGDPQLPAGCPCPACRFSEADQIAATQPFSRDDFTEWEHEYSRQQERRGL